MFNLKPPQSIFVHADGFHKAARYLNKPPETGQVDPLCFAALVSNSAFASELYLKCLLQIETGQLFKAQHDLRKLFLKLPGKTQTEIEKPFNALMDERQEYDLSKAPKDDLENTKKMISSQPKNLREALAKGRDAFVTWRYLYEADDSALMSFNLFSLPPILRQVILVRHPEWEGFRIRMKRVAGPLSTSQSQNKPVSAAEAPRLGGGNQ